jgi:hypothetical protein
MNKKLARIAVLVMVSGMLVCADAEAQSCDPTWECYEICREAAELAASAPYDSCANATLIRSSWAHCETLLNNAQDQDSYDLASWGLAQIQEFSDNKCKAQ